MGHTRSIPTDALSILAQGRTPIMAQVAVKFAVLVTKWATRRQTRLALGQLESWQLDDVGLTPTQAESESGRVFWQV